MQAGIFNNKLDSKHFASPYHFFLYLLHPRGCYSLVLGKDDARLDIQIPACVVAKSAICWNSQHPAVMAKCKWSVHETYFEIYLDTCIYLNKGANSIQSCMMSFEIFAVFQNSKSLATADICA